MFILSCLELVVYLKNPKMNIKTWRLSSSSFQSHHYIHFVIIDALWWRLVCSSALPTNLSAFVKRLNLWIFSNCRLALENTLTQPIIVTQHRETELTLQLSSSFSTQQLALYLKFHNISALQNTLIKFMAGQKDSTRTERNSKEVTQWDTLPKHKWVPHRVISWLLATKTSLTANLYGCHFMNHIIVLDFHLTLAYGVIQNWDR